MRALLLSLLLLPLPALADVYTIGSSYTWDGFPETLEDSPQWHIACGVSLFLIFRHPGFVCVSGSPWPTTLPSHSFDAISFQPVDVVSTLLNDITVITTWLEDQPTADVVIHHTWPLPAAWEAVLHSRPDHTQTNRSLEYGYELIEDLALVLPGREIRLTRANEMLDRIYHDCAAGACPLPGGFDDMFRDASGHMSNGPGTYLDHNALRAAFGQPQGVDPNAPPFEVDPAVRAYLDGVVLQYAPEPTGPLPIALGAAVVVALGRVRRRGIAVS